MTDNQKTYAGLDATAQKIVAALKAKDYKQLYGFVCAASKKEANEEKYISDVSNGMKQMESMGQKFKDIKIAKDWEFIQDNKLKSIEDIAGLDQVDLTLHFITEMNINGHPVEGRAGQVWQFVFENGQWCVRYPL